MELVTTAAGTTVRLGVRGMTCASCVGRIESALLDAPEVAAASADLPTASVLIRTRNGRAANLEALNAAVANAGYKLVASPDSAEGSAVPGGLRKPVLFAGLAATALLGLYLGLVTLAQGWTHALQLLAQDAAFVGPIVLGFGMQIGLFVYLRRVHTRAAKAGMAAGTGTSTAAMLACCVHHLAEVLPVLGLSAAAVVLESIKVPLLGLGVGMNLIGVAYLLLLIRKQRRMACHAT